jgi:hypothetical protein
MASMMAIAVSLLGIYAFGESFLLKMDKLPAFVLLWSAALLENRDTNHIAAEFHGEPDPPGREGPLRCPPPSP